MKWCRDLRCTTTLLSTRITPQELPTSKYPSPRTMTEIDPPLITLGQWLKTNTNRSRPTVNRRAWEWVLAMNKTVIGKRWWKWKWTKTTMVKKEPWSASWRLTWLWLMNLTIRMNLVLVIARWTYLPLLSKALITYHDQQISKKAYCNVPRNSHSSKSTKKTRHEH